MEERPVETPVTEEAEGLDLHAQYAKKAEEMKEKYHAAVVAIAEKQGVDMGVAFDMLKAVARGAGYAEGIELDVEALKADYEELAAISELIVNTGM